MFASSGEKESTYTRLHQPSYKHIASMLNAFIDNKHRLYMSPDLTEMVYDRAEKVRP